MLPLLVGKLHPSDAREELADKSARQRITLKVDQQAARLENIPIKVAIKT